MYRSALFKSVTNNNGCLLSLLTASSISQHRFVHDNQVFTVVEQPWNLASNQPGVSRTKKWDYYNKVVWPPHYKDPVTGQPKVPEVFHYRENIKYSHSKMWQVCHLIRGMSVDEALKQLDFLHRKGAKIAMEVIKEAQQKAVERNNIEYKSNLWIAEAFPEQSLIIQGIRRKARRNPSIIRYRYCNLFLRLEEGKPPAYTSRDPPRTGWTKMHEHLKYLRDRKIHYPL